MLDAFVTERAKSLKGTIGIANAKMAYQHYKRYFQSEPGSPAEKGARVRVLYGSTGTKSIIGRDVCGESHWNTVNQFT
jgi:hypothetical protein